MRKTFVQQLLQHFGTDPTLVLISGDLGYNAFETIQEKYPTQFINAGIAEQSMIGIAAGMAKNGRKVIVYSIAPFVTFRCLEQIRLDICLHQIPVLIVGNGGGYQYGINGPTHHALSDLACMSSLPHITCRIPADNQEVAQAIDRWVEQPSCTYLRLGESINHAPAPPKSDAAASTIILGLGTIATELRQALQQQGPAHEEALRSVAIWAINQLPLPAFTPQEINQLKAAREIIVVEDHTERGGAAEALAMQLLKNGIHPQRYTTFTANQIDQGLYGDRTFHYLQSHIHPTQIMQYLLSHAKQ